MTEERMKKALSAGAVMGRDLRGAIEGAQAPV